MYRNISRKRKLAHITIDQEIMKLYSVRLHFTYLNFKSVNRKRSGNNLISIPFYDPVAWEYLVVSTIVQNLNAIPFSGRMKDSRKHYSIASACCSALIEKLNFPNCDAFHNVKSPTMVDYSSSVYSLHGSPLFIFPSASVTAWTTVVVDAPSFR